MPKYLIKGSYTAEGVQGLLKEGGSARRAVLTEAIGKIGGTLEAFYFAFGDDDVYVIADIPDNVSMAALALVPVASGTVGIKTTVLLTPEEVDEAARKSVSYRPPGAKGRKKK
jgi:uncharacterized protein with GYD domain